MTDNLELTREFVARLQLLVGKICWRVYAGENTGSDVDLVFGSKIAGKPPHENPNLTPEGTINQGEVSLFITSTWRLDSNDAVICGSADPSHKGGPMVEGLGLLIGRRVESLSILEPAWDLTLAFSGQLFLKVFCVETIIDEGNDNYSFHTKNAIFVVGPRGKIRREFGLGGRGRFH